ncbi:class I SAM-dependent methyltransferase [Wenjunlia tyrosinilytica]|uniref:Methyltransferase type 11 n=1 Tax=Wenjunlia tyrosinilytica TaxID=1544741 RepID=A0A918E145_9ACTN|nr:methyltransferase domain-containing protein [Wenjunlia tyrosinilytica]GGO94989.1 methyltransferase type 11 [Wenjunlia tyrosinilytica]
MRPWCTDPYADALLAGRGPLFLRRDDGWLLPLEVERWCAHADEADMTVLRRCEGAVIDIGCGPGRLVAAVARQGHPALGVDLSPAAVARTVSAGGTALCRSVFDRLPGEGRWGTALLLDGNIGIGGDPHALLRRVARLVDTGGLLLVEAASADVDERVRVRVDDGRGGLGGSFPWARLGLRALRRHSEATGWRAAREWTAGGRSFLELRRVELPGAAAPHAAVARAQVPGTAAPGAHVPDARVPGARVPRAAVPRGAVPRAGTRHGDGER